MCYQFHEGLNAAKTACRICEVYKPDALKKRSGNDARFRVGNFSVKDVELLGRSQMVDTNKMNFGGPASDLVREIQEILDMSHGSVDAPQRHRSCEQNGCVGAALRSLQQRLDTSQQTQCYM